MTDQSSPLTPEEQADWRRALPDLPHDEWCASKLDGPDEPCSCYVKSIARLLATIDAIREAVPDVVSLNDAYEKGKADAALASQPARAGVRDPEPEGDISPEMWAKFTAGEKLAYGMGYRRAGVREPERPDLVAALREAARTLSDAYWPDALTARRMSEAINRIDDVAAALSTTPAPASEPDPPQSAEDEFADECRCHHPMDPRCSCGCHVGGCPCPDRYPALFHGSRPSTPASGEAVAPLHVERLARAIEYTGDGEGDGYRGARYREYAANLAREYAALAPKEPTDD